MLILNWFRKRGGKKPDSPSPNSPLILGDFLDQLSNQDDSLELTFSPTSRPIKQRWKNNRLSANFVADYLSNFLPISDESPQGQRQKEESRGVVSYIANELLENALKFHDVRSNRRVKFSIHLLENAELTIALCVTNVVAEPGKIKFQAFIEHLLASDPAELYIQQMEKTAAENDGHASGLGFLSMIHDYSARLGWKFEPIQQDPLMFAVTTTVQLQVEE